MVNQILTPVYPVAGQFLAIGKELVSATPPAIASFATIPIADFGPDPKLAMIRDDAFRGSYSNGPYDLQGGAFWVESAIKESPLFGDSIGHVLLNIFGDYTATGTATTPVWTTSAALSPGAGPIAVTLASAAVAGTFIQVGSVAGTTEVVTVGVGSTTTSIVLNAATPLRLSHLTGVAITTVTAPFSHVFSLLNPASSTGNVTGQPPSHSIGHRNQVAGAAGFYADLFPYGCFSSLKLNGAATGFLTWEGSLTSWPQTAPASAFTPVPSGVHAMPAWKGTSTIGGTPISNVSTWGMTFTRELEPIVTIDGQQAPSGIARGGLSGQFSLSIMPAVDESMLLNYVNNNQPSLLWTTSNGLSGSSLVSFSVAAQLGGFGSAKLVPGKTVYGYDASGDLILNTTNAGNSGGYSPCQVTIQNAIPTY